MSNELQRTFVPHWTKMYQEWQTVMSHVHIVHENGFLFTLYTVFIDI